MNADVLVGTLYNPEHTTQMTDRGQNYAFNINAYLGVMFFHQAFEAYKSQYDTVFKAIDFTPYGQHVYWDRFDNKEGFGGGAKGYRYLTIGEWSTRIRENAKTCSWSALSGQLPGAHNCYFDDDKQTDYKDSVWKWSLTDYVLGKGQLTEVLGSHNYYSVYKHM